MSEESDSHKSTRPTIFFVEEDDDVRPHLTRSLRRNGYRVLVAADMEDAREWVDGEGHIHADLVLVNLVGQTPEECLSRGRELRNHAKYDGQTPLVVLPERVPEEFEGRDVNVGGNDWVCYYDEDSTQLRLLLARLLSRPPVE